MCTFGKLHTLSMKLVLNNAFRFGMPIINKVLSGVKINIPTHIGKYFELSDLAIGYFDDFLAIGLTPTFVKPSEPAVEAVFTM